MNKGSENTEKNQPDRSNLPKPDKITPRNNREAFRKIAVEDEKIISVIRALIRQDETEKPFH
jgi:hypothetical protein